MRAGAVIRSVGAAWLLFCTQAIAGPGNDPLSWLERMATAMNQMSYQGTFVYIQGDRIETMRITHVSGEEGERERLVSLSGAPREVLRDSNGVRWVFGDDASILADSAFNRTFFPKLPDDSKSQAGRSYAFKFGGQSIIAGHTARNIKVLPRDHYRYGYSLWIEERSGLLLKWELVDTSRKPLAKLMFTELVLGSEVDRAELKSGHAKKKYRTVETELPAGGAAMAGSPRWKPERLPPGFELTTHRYHAAAEGAGGEYEHLVYSDGLTAVSVYVESPDMDIEHIETAEKHGTTHAYSCTASGMKVTVVGNVPAATVEMIGRSVALASP